MDWLHLGRFGHFAWIVLLALGPGLGLGFGLYRVLDWLDRRQH